MTTAGEKGDWGEIYGDGAIFIKHVVSALGSEYRAKILTQALHTALNFFYCDRQCMQA
jgi:hypothetical protein